MTDTFPKNEKDEIVLPVDDPPKDGTFLHFDGQLIDKEDAEEGERLGKLEEFSE